MLQTRIERTHAFARLSELFISFFCRVWWEIIGELDGFVNESIAMMDNPMRAASVAAALQKRHDIQGTSRL